MSEGVPELSIPELLDQPWTKRLARAASFAVMLILTLGGAGITGYFFSLGNRITAIEQDRTQRIIKSDQNTVHLQGKVTDLQADMDRVRSDVTALKVDLAEVKGILQEIRHSQVPASLSASPATQTMPLFAAQQR